MLGKQRVEFLLSSKDKKNFLIDQMILSAKAHLIKTIDMPQEPGKDIQIPRAIFLEYGKRMIYGTLT